MLTGMAGAKTIPTLCRAPAFPASPLPTCMRVLISWNGVPMAAPTQPAQAPATRLVRKSLRPCTSWCATSQRFRGMKVPAWMRRRGGGRARVEGGRGRQRRQGRAVKDPTAKARPPRSQHHSRQRPAFRDAPRRVPLTAIWKAKAGLMPRKSTPGPSCCTILPKPARIGWQQQGAGGIRELSSGAAAAERQHQYSAASCPTLAPTRTVYCATVQLCSAVGKFALQLQPCSDHVHRVGHRHSAARGQAAR